MDGKQIAAEFHRDGFVVVRSVFRGDEIAEVEQHLQRFLDEEAPKLEAGDVYYEDGPRKTVKSAFRLHERSEFLAGLLTDQRLVSLVKAIWPEGGVESGGVSFFGKPALDGSVTPEHQDNTFQYWDPPLALTATLAIDESTPENGVLACYAGSHIGGLLPHVPSGVMGFSRKLVDPIDAQKFPAAQLCMKPGDIAVHHINAVHGSGANSTDRSRRQLAVGFRSSLAKQDKVALDTYKKGLEDLHAKAGDQVVL